MSDRYEPQAHILPLDVAPRAENIVEQREITIQSYQTTVPFDFDALNTGLDGAWLTPQIRFGVFARSRLGGTDALDVVLGLQDELSVRTYDYDERQPLWFTWKDVVVDTVGIHYSRDEDGLLRFTTTGGGRRITDDKLHDFNSAFLGISKDAVRKRQFDLDKLRELCFDEFAERLYMLRFSDPSGQEYQSIDHALFQSRDYIDPATKRLKEIRDDDQAKIESFDSDVMVRAGELAAPVKVRFFIRGLSGSLRLRFPKLSYKNQLKTVEEQARVFYRLVDITVRSILDADYYTQERRSLDELEKLDPNLPLFPDLVDLAPFRDVLTSVDARRAFLSDIDVSDRWSAWLPHLRAIDELLQSDVIRADVTEILTDLVSRDPERALAVLAACQDDTKVRSVGAITASAVGQQCRSISPDLRAQVEAALLSWAIEHEDESWDVDASSGEIIVLGVSWTVGDFAFDTIPPVLWKLIGVLHARLMATEGDVRTLLDKLNWCMTVARELPPCHARSPAALRLVAASRVPASVADASRILKEPVADLAALDEAILDQFGLPLWPLLAVVRSEENIVVSNAGIGTALGLSVRPAGELFGGEGEPRPVDVQPGASTSLPMPGSTTSLDVTFEKFGAQHHVTLPIGGSNASTESDTNVRTLRASMSAKRLAAARGYREKIDPGGIVVGSSPALLRVFENIHHANLMGGTVSVLILGERGSGKTHIAKLIHESSDRRDKPFKETNAGGGGGDVNIQRGEWLGYGKNHGIQGIDRHGRGGHLSKAHGGTLFIDEFAAFSKDMQVIFLSVLEGRTVDKVGGEAFTPDVRCVFATNADVDELAAEGTLRPDLLDRIGVTIVIPPLRDRMGDILLLAKYFAGDHRISDHCLIALLRHDWPGNVRELQRTVQQAVARKQAADASALDLDHLDLGAAIIASARAIDEVECRGELWRLADEISRGEGLGAGNGLQKRAGEIMGVGQAQASKMYRQFGLAQADLDTGAA